MRTPSVSRRFAAIATIVVCTLGSPAVFAVSAQSRDTVVRLSSSAVVDITLRTGRLIVRGVDGPTGSVRGGGRDYQLRPSGVGMVLDGHDRDDDRKGPLEVDVPRGVRLVVNTSSADIELYALRGEVELRTMSGDVRGEGLSGRVVVETLSGDLDLAGSITQLRVTTVSGDLRVRGLRGRATVKTTSGDVDIEGDRITGLDFASMSGDLLLGGVADDAQADLSTHSGDVTVRLPGSAKGRLDVSTFAGKLESGGPLTLLPSEVAGDARGRARRRYVLNGGGAMQLDISTFSGDVRLERDVRP